MDAVDFELAFYLGLTGFCYLFMIWFLCYGTSHIFNAVVDLFKKFGD